MTPIRISLVTLLVVIACIFDAASSAKVAQQSSTAKGDDKVITYFSHSGNSPIEFTKITIKDKQVRFGEPFAAEDDFLKSLSFDIKNVSKKNIAYISLGIRIPVINSQQTGRDIQSVLIPFDHGSNPATAGMPNSFVSSGQSVNIVFPESRFAARGKMLSVVSHDPSKVIVSVEVVSFDDNTTWRMGYIHRQDPNNPRKWVKTAEELELISMSGSKLNGSMQFASLKLSNGSPAVAKVIKRKQSYCVYEYNGTDWEVCGYEPGGFLCSAEQPIVTYNGSYTGVDYVGYTYYSCIGYFEPWIQCSTPVIGSNWGYCV